MCALLESMDEPWMCMGDFNMVLDDVDKVGGRMGNSSCPNYLKEIMFDTNYLKEIKSLPTLIRHQSS